MVLTITYLVAFQCFVYYLKAHHSELWLALGSPSVLNNSPLNGWRTVKFIFSDVHRSLRDTALTKAIFMLRALFIACAFIFLGLGIIFPFLKAS